MPPKLSVDALRGREHLVLTASILQSADGIGEQPHAAQEASTLLLVDLLVVPHTDGYRVGFPNVPVRAHNLFRYTSELCCPQLHASS